MSKRKSGKDFRWRSRLKPEVVKSQGEFKNKEANEASCVKHLEKSMGKKAEAL